MRKLGVLAVGFALAMGLARPAAAETIFFDTNGVVAGGVMQADVFDWLPGNSLLVENATGTQGTVYFQANLGTITGPPPGPSGDFANGSCLVGICNFKAVAGFGVNIIPDPPNEADFTFDATSTTNFFKIYADVTSASDLTGSCFVCGIEILSGHAVAAGFSSSFSLDDPDTTVDENGDGDPANDFGTPVGPLDQFNIDNYPGIQSVLGHGSTNLRVVVDSFDPTYFLNLIAGQTLAFTNTSQIAPYNQADPSAFFTNNGIVNANEPGAIAVGPVNGLCIGIAPCRIVSQSDANTSFTGVTAVPEPATLTLLGLGLAGSALRRRKAQKAKA